MCRSHLHIQYLKSCLLNNNAFLPNEPVWKGELCMMVHERVFFLVGKRDQGDNTATYTLFTFSLGFKGITVQLQLSCFFLHRTFFRTFSIMEWNEHLPFILPNYDKIWFAISWCSVESFANMWAEQGGITCYMVQQDCLYVMLTRMNFLVTQLHIFGLIVHSYRREIIL